MTICGAELSGRFSSDGEWHQCELTSRKAHGPKAIHECKCGFEFPVVEWPDTMPPDPEMEVRDTTPLTPPDVIVACVAHAYISHGITRAEYIAAVNWLEAKR